MSFKIAHYLNFLMGLVVALFFILLGSVGVILPVFPVARQRLSNFILDQPWILFLFGLSLVLIGAACIAGIIYGSRRHYYAVKSGPHKISISDSLFHDYLSSYWKKIFPNHEIPCTVKIKNNQVHITADLPYVPLPEQKGLIEQMQVDVTDIFSRYLGYRAEYLFSVSFLDQKPAT